MKPTRCLYLVLMLLLIVPSVFAEDRLARDVDGPALTPGAAPVAWPTVSKHQVRRAFDVRSLCEDPDCEADDDGEYLPDEQDWGTGDSSCFSCFNPCMKIKVCSITAASCTSYGAKSYSRCKNNAGSKTQPCEAC